MSRGTLRIGFVGAGMISQYHLQGWTETKGAEVVAICDPDLEKARRRAETFGIASVFSDLSSMLEVANIEAVDIATPVGTHARLVMQAADHGVHVMCQKPITPTLQEAYELIDYVGDRVRFMVHENYRFRPHYRQAREWITAGQIGSPLQVRLTMRSSGMVALGAEEAWLLARQPYLGKMPRLLIFETLIHHLDTLRSLIGEMDVLSCQLAHINHSILGEDTAIVVMRAQSGCLVVLDGTFSAPGYPAQVTDRLEIIGGQGTIIFENDELREMGSVERSIHYASSSPKGENQECFTIAVQHFVEGITTGRAFPTDRLDNLKTMRLMEACYAAAGTI
jgi:D-apiose dehydrogenase